MKHPRRTLGSYGIDNIEVSVSAPVAGCTARDGGGGGGGGGIKFQAMLQATACTH